jgi:hypothetical protein
MENVGEEIVGSYLKWVMKCDFVEYNLSTKNTQGEIDVIGINLENKLVYVCEVATHMETGLQYVKNRQPDNVDRFLKKFTKDIEYANEFFPEFDKIFMLWSPIVKSTKKGSKHNQMIDIKNIQDTINSKYGITIQLILNETFLKCLDELRKIAFDKTQEMPTKIMRFLQIEEKTRVYVNKLSK